MTMQAFGIQETGGAVDVLVAFDAPAPELRPRDVLIRIVSCAMNPVDTKLRALPTPPTKILGWDGAGVVEALGSEAKRFNVGDKVYCAGSHIRNGTNADLVAVDERIVGYAPSSVTATVASSVPLVVLTVWEGLEQLGLNPKAPLTSDKTILMLPGAGGVGSYGIQIAKMCGVKVIATASRPESEKACKEMGADFVINHKEPLKPQLEALGISGVDFIYDAVSFESYADQFFDIIKPFGKIVTITAIGSASLDKFKPKAVSVCFEFMFARALYESEDMEHQSEILNDAAALIDAGKLKTPIWKVLPWSLDSLKEAHTLQASGAAIGKIVMTKESGSNL
jgi:NADPH2:quinone reductase